MAVSMPVAERNCLSICVSPANIKVVGVGDCQRTRIHWRWQRIEARMIRLKWSGNGSSHYDGKVQDVERRFVVAEDHEELGVGSTVRVWWGRQERQWAAVVVSLLDDKQIDESDGDDGAADEEATTLPRKQ